MKVNRILLKIQQPTIKSIGMKKVWSHLFKTKEHAVAAGLSLLPEMFHLEELLLVIHLLTTPYNNYLTAPKPFLIMVAKVDGHTKPLSTL